MTWQIDPVHSTIGFSARHLMVAKVRGEFTRFDGEVRLDEARPERSTVAIEIAAESIDSGAARRAADRLAAVTASAEAHR